MTPIIKPLLPIPIIESRNNNIVTNHKNEEPTIHKQAITTMKKILFVIILLSTIQVATAQQRGKENPWQRYERERRQQALNEYINSSCHNNRINSENNANNDLRNNPLRPREIDMPTNLLDKVRAAEAAQQLGVPHLNIITEKADPQTSLAKEAEHTWLMYTRFKIGINEHADDYTKGKLLFQDDVWQKEHFNSRTAYYKQLNSSAAYYLVQELQHHPQNGRALYYLARINDGYIDRALACISKNDTEYYSKALLLKGIYSFKEKDTIAAMACFKDGIYLTHLYVYTRNKDMGNGWSDDMMDMKDGYTLSWRRRPSYNRWEWWGDILDMRDVYTTARYYRACVYLSRGDTSDAIKELDVVIKEKGQIGLSAYLLRMELNHELKNYQLIRKDYRQLAISYPELIKNAEIQAIMTEAEMNMGSVDRACSHLDSAMKYNSDYAWMYLKYWKQRDSVQAIPFLDAFADRIAKRDSISFPDELNLVLESFRAREKYEELIELYNRQKSIYSTYAPLYLYASIGYLGTGDMKNTVETYQKFKETFNPMDTSLGTYYAYTFDSLTIESMDNYVQWCQAVIHIENADFDDAIAIINNLPDTILDKDICLPFAITTNAKKGDYDIALRQSNRLVEMDPSADSYTSRGWVYYRRGEKDLAKADFQKVLVLESDSVTWNTAGAYLCLGDRRNAKRTARKLLSADSLSFEDYWLASLFYESIGNERKAIKYIKQALSIATKEEKNFYSWKIWSYETPSLAAKVATIINQQ